MKSHNFSEPLWNKSLYKLTFRLLVFRHFSISFELVKLNVFPNITQAQALMPGLRSSQKQLAFPSGSGWATLRLKRECCGWTTLRWPPFSFNTLPAQVVGCYLQKPWNFFPWRMGFGPHHHLVSLFWKAGTFSTRWFEQEMTSVTGCCSALRKLHCMPGGHDGFDCVWSSFKILFSFLPGLVPCLFTSASEKCNFREVWDPFCLQAACFTCYFLKQYLKFSQLKHCKPLLPQALGLHYVWRLWFDYSQKSFWQALDRTPGAGWTLFSSFSFPKLPRSWITWFYTPCPLTLPPAPFCCTGATAWGWTGDFPTNYLMAFGAWTPSWLQLWVQLRNSVSNIYSGKLTHGVHHCVMEFPAAHPACTFPDSPEHAFIPIFRLFPFSLGKIKIWDKQKKRKENNFTYLLCCCCDSTDVMFGASEHVCLLCLCGGWDL